MLPLNAVQLQCLDSVVREGSIRAAAAALGLSQPSVSQHVGNLERRLGVQLLHRSVRGASLTEAGTEMLPHFRSVLRAEEAARQRAASLRGTIEGRVRIGAVSGAMSSLVPEAVRMTMDIHSELVFEVFQMAADEVQDRVLDGTVDVGLLVDDTRIKFPDVRAELLAQGPLMFLARKGHHLLEQDSVTRSEVAGEPWILLTPGHVLRERILEFFHGYNLRVVGESDSHETIRRLVAAGLGVTLMPWMTLSHNPGVPTDLRGRPLSDITGRPGLWLIYLPEHLSGAVEILIDSIRATVPSDSR